MALAGWVVITSSEPHSMSAIAGASLPLGRVGALIGMSADISLMGSSMACILGTEPGLGSRDNLSRYFHVCRIDAAGWRDQEVGTPHMLGVTRGIPTYKGSFARPIYV